MSFVETPERHALRSTVATLAGKYGWGYTRKCLKEGRRPTELWEELGRAGFLGVNIPEEFGGGGAGVAELAIVMEEVAAAGCPLIMMVVSPAICGTIISRFGTPEQKTEWLPGIADGSKIMAFGITEPDAGSNSHKLTTVARRDGSDWLLSGRKVYITGVDGADAVLIVGRTEDSKSGKLRPALFIVPREIAGFEYRRLEMDINETQAQFLLFLDDVRLPGEALVGQEGAALGQLFAGLNPERIMASAMATGMGRYALAKAVEYLKTREVWGTPIGAHQGLSHPLAQCHIELELARLMWQKAASLVDAGEDVAAGESANMAKYAAAEASIRTLDQAIQCHGGNGLTSEYGLAAMLGEARISRVAPVSREMILNFVAQNSLGLPRSY